MIASQNFIVEKYLGLTGYKKTTGEPLYYLTQVKDGQVQVSIDNSVDVVDAVGAKIETIQNGESGTFSASNALFSWDLVTAQTGGTRVEASITNKIKYPRWESFTTTAGQTSVVLAEVPVGTEGAEIPYIFALNKDGTMSTKYTIAAAASATAFQLDPDTKTLTLPTGLTAGTRVHIQYEYEGDVGFKITKSPLNKNEEHKVVALVLGHDVCDKTTKYAAWQVFPCAKLSSEIDLTFTPDMEHPFTLDLVQDYCDTEKTLFEFLLDGNAMA